MTTHAPLPDTATVSARIAQLSLLPMDCIWAMWDEHFGQRPNHHHRTWLESRLASLMNPGPNKPPGNSFTTSQPVSKAI